jgi:hypothetical protein
MEVAEQCVHLLLSEVFSKLIARANLLLWRWSIIWEALELDSLCLPVLEDSRHTRVK